MNAPIENPGLATRVDMIEPTKIPSDEANEKMRARTLGRANFEAYAAKMGGFTYDGNRIPPWTALPNQVKDAWESAAEAVKARVPGGAPKTAEESQ